MNQKKATAKKAAIIHGPWKVKRKKIVLIQNQYNEWLLVIEDGPALPATDALVNLWLDNLELKSQLSALEAQIA